MTTHITLKPTGRTRFTPQQLLDKLRGATKKKRRAPQPTVIGEFHANGSVTLPIVLVNELNDHKHWRGRQARAKRQHKLLSKVLPALQKPAIPCVVTMTRLSRGTLDDDGAVSSCKFVRDAIAKWVGVDDKHNHVVRYEVRQERAAAFGVRIEFRNMEVA